MSIEPCLVLESDSFPAIWLAKWNSNLEACSGDSELCFNICEIPKVSGVGGRQTLSLG
jgi:hypothetical protein